VGISGVGKASEDFIQEAKRIIELSEKRGIILRLMGACAIRLHCPKYKYLFETMERPLTDLDFMTYSKFRPLMKPFFSDLGYTPSASFVLSLSAGNRQIFLNKISNITVDVFFDKLEMCYTIEFKGRLELDHPTITLSDLLLEKMQIVKITEKDIKDAIIMLREHDIGENEKEKMNAKYIAKLLSNDWGFYYTVTTNLNEIKEFLGQYEVLTEEDRMDVASKIDKLLGIIENEPKSFKWKIRAKVGTSQKWYREVEELTR